MTKFFIVLCILIASAAAKPGLIAPAPLAYSAPLTAAYAAPLSAVAAPLAYSAPVAAPFVSTYAAAPIAYTNTPLDAAYASDRVDIRQNYNAAFVPTTFAAAAPVAPFAPFAPVAPVAPVEPLKYTAATSVLL